MKRNFSFKTIALYTIGVIVTAFAILFVGGLIMGRVAPADSTITGELTINGYFPENAVVQNFGREITNDKTQAEFQKLNEERTAQARMHYSWDGVKADRTYQGYMVLVVDGKRIAQSEVETVKAPATNIAFVINSTLTPPVTNPEHQTVSGSIIINGIIPSNSTVTVEARVSGEGEYQVVQEGIPAASTIQFTNSNGEVGKSYDIRAKLLTGTTVNGTSAIQKVTVPARNINILINSTYQPPQVVTPTKTRVSGSLFVNGSIPGNASFRVLSRKTGSGDYQVISENIAVVNGVQWEWNNAYSGVAYDFKAQIIQYGTVLSEGFNTNVTAPATGVNITVATNAPLSAPPTAPRTSCDAQNGSVWTAATTVDAINNNQGVKQYWLMVGTQPGFADTYNVRWAAGTDTEYRQKIQNINQNTEYYTQYAWSDCADCTEVGQFSQFARSSFHCPK